MEQFKLSNLRELSTEEQLRLNGGANTDECSCASCGSCSCSCGMLDKASTDAIKEDVRKNSKTALARDSKKG